MVRGK